MNNKMKRDSTPPGFAMIFIMCSILAISVYADDLSFSTDEDCVISSVTPSDHEIAQTDMEGSWALILSSLTAQLPPGANIDALDFKSESSVYFSLDADTMIAGYVYADEDIIFWNGSALSPGWDGSSNGLPVSANLNALHVISEEPLQFLFSLDVSANLAGVGFVSDEDIILFETGAGFTGIPFDGSENGVSPNADLDALAVLGNTQWLISFDVPLKAGELELDDSDIVVWNPDTSLFETSLWFDASSHSIPDYVDIDAIRVEAIMQNIIDYLLGRIPWQENFDVNKDSDVDIADVVELIITP